MKTLLCAIAKQENNYIREWIEWYYNLGTTHIILYDNNDVDGERFDEVISDYIDSGFVEIIDYRGKIDCQRPAYTECYNKYKDKYDWFMFLDIDELLKLECSNLEEFLSNPKYNNFNGIRVWWKMFDDNGLIKVENNNYSMYSRFTHPAEEHIDNHQTKMIVRGGQKGLIYKDSPHYPNNLKKVCNTLGKPMILEDWLPKGNSIYDIAVINHYRCKTIEEYVLNKMKRLWPNETKEWGEKTLTLDYFFRRNKRTKEKEELAKQLLGIKIVNPEDWKIKNNVDILYIIGKGSKWNNQELKYSLRGVAKNGYNINRIFIVGNIPNFVNRETTICIPLEDATKIKHYNMLLKIDYVIQHTDIGKDNDGKFLVSSDDHFYIQPVNFDGYPIYNTGLLPDEIHLKNEAGNKEWQLSLVDTKKLLESYNLPYYKFNWHGNTWFNSRIWNDPIFKEIRNKSLEVKEGLEPTAIMLNYLKSVENFPTLKRNDLKIKKFKNRTELLNKIGDSECFSIYDSAIGCGIGKYLEELFPDKCKYER